MFTRLPLCRPVPEKLAERLSVCWLSTDELDKTAARLASVVMLLKIYGLPVKKLANESDLI
jgi:hypothetical protein